MLKYFQKRYALTEQGAKDMLKSIGWTVLVNYALMMPMMLAMIFMNERLAGLNGETVPVHSMVFYGVTALIMFLVMYVLINFQYVSVFVREYEESARKRLSLAETMRKLPLSYFGKKDISDLSATIMQDLTELENLFSHTVPQLYGAIIILPLTGIFMFLFDWRMGLAAFWSVPVAALCFMLSLGYQRREKVALFDLTRGATEKVQECLDTAYEIKSYNREGAMVQGINDGLDTYEKAMIKGELLSGAIVNFSYILLQLALPTVVIVGAMFLAQGSLSVFAYLAFILVTARLYNPLTEVLNNLAALAFLDARIQRMQEIDTMERQTGRQEFHPKDYNIRFDNVTFSYEKGVQTLKDISFTANQGEVTALVGPSGGGKSTAAKLSARFWDIDSGTIRLGGEDIADIDPEKLMENYAIVFQDVTLFNTSVMENIRLGRKGATDEEVMTAAALAQCDDFVQKMPEGYNTMVGENGEKLSGGERQRISIARAILKDAPIILMDEATASLDAENETKIQKALTALSKDKTVLLIAHRMRTVIGADKIVVLKDGQVVEQGTPSALRQQQGLFAKLLKAQYDA